MRISVLFELGSTVHTGGDRDTAFHPQRQEAVSMQVRSGGISPELPIQVHPRPLSSLPAQLISQKSYSLNWVK